MKKLLLSITILLTFIGCGREVRKKAPISNKEYINRYITADTFAVYELSNTKFLKNYLSTVNSDYRSKEEITVTNETLDILDGSIYLLFTKDSKANLNSNNLKKSLKNVILTAHIDLLSVDEIIKSNKDVVKEGSYYRVTSDFLPKGYYYIDREHNFLFLSDTKENLDRLFKDKSKNPTLTTIVASSINNNNNLGTLYSDNTIYNAITESFDASNRIIKKEALDKKQKDFLGFSLSGNISKDNTLTFNIKEKIASNPVNKGITNKKLSSIVDKNNSLYLSLDNSKINDKFDFKEITNVQSLALDALTNIDNDLYIDIDDPFLVISQRNRKKASEIVEAFNKEDVEVNIKGTNVKLFATLTTDQSGTHLITINSKNNLVREISSNKKTINSNDIFYLNINNYFMDTIIPGIFTDGFAITISTSLGDDGSSTDITIENYQELKSLFSLFLFKFILSQPKD